MKPSINFKFNFDSMRGRKIKNLTVKENNITLHNNNNIVNILLSFILDKSKKFTNIFQFLQILNIDLVH